jgi:hypothetical protein
MATILDDYADFIFKILTHDKIECGDNLINRK